MNVRVIRKWAGLAMVAALLAACGNNEAEVKAMVQKMHMSKPQEAAFRACAKDLKSSKPIFIDGQKAVQLTKVPLGICACHSVAVAKIFKDDKMTGHARFAAYIGKTKRKELRLGRRDMRVAMDPAKAGLQLINSLKTCATDFAAANTEEFKNLIVPFELPKPKPKKPAEGEEQQASKS